MSDANGGQGYAGFAAPGVSQDGYNATQQQILALLKRCNTNTLVKVLAVTTSGGVGPVGFVDVQPLVKQIDGAGNTYGHAPIYHCPYFRLQGGGNAVILDPQVGDIGLAAFASRDISSVVANKAEAAPGSLRLFDMADGIYFGGLLGGAPTQFVQFNSAGITISSPAAVTIDAPDVTINSRTLEINATTSVTVTTPNFHVVGASTLTGATTIVGLTTLQGSLAQTATGGAVTATLAGSMNITGDVTIAGKSFLGHEHNAGGSPTGPPL